MMAVLLAALTPACREASRPDTAPTRPRTAPWFEDVTASVGLAFVHDPGPAEDYFMPRSIGSGAAFLDANNDGRLDILLLQNAGPDSESRHGLFLQGADGRFTDASPGSGLDVAGHAMGVAIGDLNNDGWPDVVITEYRGLRLFLNRRDGTFRDITGAADLDNPGWGASLACVDVDRDGWLDLVVVNYVEYQPSQRCWGKDGQPEFCGPSGFPGSVTRLFRNLGPTSPDDPDSIRFRDVTVASGLARGPGPGLGLVAADFDGDGWPDLFVADDARPNRLWVNRRDGTFRDEALARGLALDLMGRTRANMGVALGDVTGNGLFDLFVTHLLEEHHALWTQEPRGLFQDRTAQLGLGDRAWRGTGFGTVLVDFDHDGHLDLAIANGGIRRDDRPTHDAAATRLPPFWAPYAQRNQIFRNQADGRFLDISPDQPAFCGHATVSRGLAFADFDLDGAVDLLVTDIAAPARLYRNVAPKHGAWLVVRATDPALGGRDAYGAEITVVTPAARHIRWLNPASSFLCSNDPRAHFGLGPVPRIDAIEIRWPDGLLESFPGPTLNQVVALARGTGRPLPP